MKMATEENEVYGKKKREKKQDMPDFSLCDTEEDVQKLNDLIDNLW
jgi:hypothetical protein